MQAVVTVVWDLLATVGGGLALTFIVVIALGINAITLLFLGSAVVALEHFARAALRWRSVLGFGLVWSFLVGAGVLYWGQPELALQSRSQWFVSWLAATAAGAVVVAFATAVIRFALLRIPSRHLATASLAILGLGYALVAGGSGRLVYASAPALVVGALAALLAFRRRRRPDTRPRVRTETERLLWVLSAALALGVGVALLLSGPRPEVSATGGALLGIYLAGILVGLLPLAAAGLIDARGSVEWFIALRYLTAKRRQTFISIITGICVVGIASGVWLIITVLSVMNGFERTWRDEIIGNRSHFTVHHGLGPFEDYEAVVERVTAVPGVVAANPFLDTDSVVRGPGGQLMGVKLRGVDPGRVGSVVDLEQDIVQGSLAALEASVTPEGEDPAIIIGSQLANSVGSGVGDTLVLISPFGGIQTPLGPAPRLKRFRVVGIFRSSFFQYDEMFTFVNLGAAQDFRRTDDVIDGIEVRTTDFYRSMQVAGSVQAELGYPFLTRDWKEFFPEFFQALKSERIMMFVLLAMIMVVAAFAIVSTLVMMIMEKSSDIAILKAMGARDEMIERIFAIEGTLIGLVGTALGVVAGVSVTRQIGWVQHQIEAVVGIDTLPASVYQFHTLPAELDFGQVCLAVGLAMILALGATLLPSRQGSRLDPAEALRYE